MKGLYGREEAAELIKRNSRRYAKRQMTWFRRYPDIRWFTLSERDTDDHLEDILNYLIENGIG